MRVKIKAIEYKKKYRCHFCPKIKSFTIRAIQNYLKKKRSIEEFLGWMIQAIEIKPLPLCPNCGETRGIINVGRIK